MKNSREPLQQRVEDLRGLLAECKELSKKATTNEWKELFREAIESCQSSLQIIVNYSAELEQEIKRVENAILSLESSDIETLRKSFESFVLSDTTFSVKNIGMALYDFDNLIKSIREFNEGPFQAENDL